MTMRFSSSLSTKDLLFFLRKQGWLIALVFVLVAGSAIFYALGQPNTYVARAKVAISPKLHQQVLPRQLAGWESYYLTNLTFETEIEIMRSRPLALRVARAIAPEDRAGDEEWLMNRARGIQGSLRVSRVENTRLITIEARSTDPEEAARLANSASEQYLYLTTENRLEAYRRSHAWLREQIADLEAKVQRSEEELIQYLREAELSPDTQGAIMAQAGTKEVDEANLMLAGLRSQLVDAEIERSRLRERYLEKHPKMIAINKEIEIIRGKLAEQADAERHARLEARERSIRQREKAIRYDILRRAVESNKELYDALITKLKETDLSADLTQPDIQIIEQAEVPSAPVAPDRTRIAAVGVIGGLFLGLFSGVLAEWFNPRIRSIEEFQAHFDLPVLASVPEVDDDGKRGPSRISLERPQAAASEAFRTLRTNVKFSHAYSEQRSLLVTSCLMREGKTTVAANLATTIAASGRRVLLLDTDLRNPGLHRALGIELGVGLAHYLAGEAQTADEVIRSTPVENLSVITAGLIPPNPAELLDTERLPNLIRELEGKFDQVVIDSPPLLAVADTSLVAAAAPNVILVLDVHQLNRTFTHRALKQLESVSAHVHGVALNKIDPDVQNYYYPGYYPAPADRA